MVDDFLDFGGGFAALMRGLAELSFVTVPEGREFCAS
jgi:hypothetical protein